jgi:hypothetical protein
MGLDAGLRQRHVRAGHVGIEWVVAVKRWIHYTFTRETEADPDRPGFDTDTYEQELLAQAERHGIDTVQQWINEGSVMPEVSISRENGAFVDPDPGYVSGLLPPRGPKQGRRV